MMKNFGITNILAFNKYGIIRRGHDANYNFVEEEVAMMTNEEDIDVSLKEAMKGADLFIGVSAPKVINADMVSSMNKDAIVFAMANPEP